MLSRNVLLVAGVCLLFLAGFLSGCDNLDLQQWLDGANGGDELAPGPGAFQADYAASPEFFTLMDDMKMGKRGYLPSPRESVCLSCSHLAASATLLSHGEKGWC